MYPELSPARSLSDDSVHWSQTTFGPDVFLRLIIT